MKRWIIFLLMAGLVPLLSIPFACQKNYVLEPIPAPTSTPIPAATPTCVTIPQMTSPCATGICWGAADVAEGSNYGGSPYYYGEIDLAVNGAPESTAGVTLSGTGISPVSLAYYGTQAIGGTTYADYFSADIAGLLTPGGNYTVTAVTSIGTASATLPMPAIASLDAGGVSATWSGASMLNWVVVANSSDSFTFNSGLCQTNSSPFSVPATAYPVPDTYTFAVERINYTTSITGGAGVYYVFNLDQIYVTK